MYPTTAVTADPIIYREIMMVASCYQLRSTVSAISEELDSISAWPPWKYIVAPFPAYRLDYSSVSTSPGYPIYHHVLMPLMIRYDPKRDRIWYPSQTEHRQPQIGRKEHLRRKHRQANCLFNDI